MDPSSPTEIASFIEENSQLENGDVSTTNGPQATDPPSPTAMKYDNPLLENGDTSYGNDDNDNSESRTGAIDTMEDHLYEKKILPAELSRNTVTITCESLAVGGICDVYLVGTAHVSSESCQEVQAVIDFLKPQVVFVELCRSRISILQPDDLKVPTMGEMLEMWKKNQNLFAILYSSFLAKIARSLEVFPGAEFRAAYEEAKKYGGKVILGDRPIHVTLKRTWAKMPLWHKSKLVFSLLFQTVFLPTPAEIAKMLKEMDDVDMVTFLIQEMSKQYPTLMETLVQERDQYMSATLLRVAREHNSVVAVVGKGHLPGIQKHWQQPIELKQLMIIPEKKSRKIIKTVGVAIVGIAIVTGIYLRKK